MKESGSVWTNKGSTLSDKSARKEFGLEQEEIIEAINKGKLQFRENHIHGNPYFRLLRHEVEALVKEKYGDNHLEKKKLSFELTQINSELRKLKTKMKSLEKRKTELQIILEE
ncbi:MAG: gluconate 2-dehydrogenase subunit 3 family protein [Desulfobacteraceae bacterium]|nr:gluconate 2-dehydrogenase subunit 3 family protein [Desulfobacteraceae bacterium]